MAPLIITTSFGESSSANTSHAVPCPAGVGAGDLLLALISNDAGAGTDPAATVTLSGFTEIATRQNTTFADRGTVLARVCDGSEGADFTLGISVSEDAIWWLFRIEGWEGTLAGVEATSAASAGGSTAPNPPSLTPSWGSAENLWFVFATTNNGSNTASAYPANYTDNQAYQGASGVFSAVATRTFTDTVQDPGTFTTTFSERTAVFTIAVRPGTSGNAGGGGGGVAKKARHIHTQMAA